ncbi:MAG: hypothetical protein WC662_00625 [Candidatus Paceibacterota bacterium]|jgi:hypothetical protein
MSNKYGISKKDEENIRARDKTCVYCHKEMKKYLGVKGTRMDTATIEHLSNEGPFNKKSLIVICCSACNSSRRNKKLLDWFKIPYCIERNINKNTVAESVWEYIRYVENFIDQCSWKFAKTMADIPHSYVVRDYLSENDKKIFDEFKMFIRKNGYPEKFFSKEYIYYDVGGYKYWVLGNILNRAEIKVKGIITE